MFDWLPYRLTFARTDKPQPRPPASPRIGKRLAFVVGSLAALGTTGIFSLPAAAGTAGSLTATIPIGILSLTVSPSSVTYDECGGTVPPPPIPVGLAFPNGVCRTTAGITITNTGLPGRIQVQGSDAVPQGGGTPHWALCLPGDAVHAGTCSGPAPIPGSLIRTPGLDQFRETLDGPRLFGLELGNTPICDLAFLGVILQGSACELAAPGAAVTEFPHVFGPFRSTNPALSFTTTITWTVIG